MSLAVAFGGTGLAYISNPFILTRWGFPDAIAHSRHSPAQRFKAKVLSSTNQLENKYVAPCSYATNMAYMVSALTETGKH